MRTRKSLTALVALVAIGSGTLGVRPAGAAVLPYLDPTLPVPTRVADLLGRMSLDEKIGQMTQGERATVANADVTTYRLGSVLSGGGSGPATNNATSWANMYDGYQNGALATPLKIPIIYGVDAVHGHNNVNGATMFPHNIGLGATRDAALVQQIGRATAEEIAGTGIDWDFAPCLCVARNDRWGRTYESYGEIPEIPTMMASYISGLQDGNPSILATAKHYLGDGGTTNGTNAGNTQITEAELRAIHLPPFREAVARKVGSVMVSYSSWNGLKMHAGSYLINTVLKGELGFSGFVVSDYNGIDQIDGQAGFTAAEVSTAINAGLDMVMVPNDWKRFIDVLRAEVQNGHISMTRIDDANRRILTQKFQLGLFEHPLTDRTWTSSVGSAAHRAIARQAVRESQVLLKNAGNVLPLAKSGGKIFVAGKNADDIGNQSGGWTITWQGGSGNTTAGTSILQGIRTAAAGTTVTYNRDGTGVDGSYRAAIAVVGETPYAEGAGDRPGSLSLDAADLAVIAKLKAAGIPVIVVLVSGRPLDIATQVGGWNALLASWLPGTEGAGVADVLFGDYNPTGTLPMTWMNSASQEPINDGDGKPALYPLGFGLNYSNTPVTVDPYAVVQAENATANLGVQFEATTDTGGGQDAGYITTGDYLQFDNVDFGTAGATRVASRVADGTTAGGTLTYRLDSPTGPAVATATIAPTGGWQTWASVSATVTGATGVHRLYLTFSRTGTGDFTNLNWFQFSH